MKQLPLFKEIEKTCTNCKYDPACIRFFDCMFKLDELLGEYRAVDGGAYQLWEETEWNN